MWYSLATWCAALALAAAATMAAEVNWEIAMWSASSQAVFYAAVGLAIVNIGAAILAPYPEGSLEVLVFLFVLAACGYSLWRVWRREHTYGY